MNQLQRLTDYRVQDQESIMEIRTERLDPIVSSNYRYQFRLDTSSYIDAQSGKKLGLGSSAAIIVALVAAIKNCDDPEKIKLLTHKAHKQLQGGLGSGADVATSLFGGLIKYQQENYTTKSLIWPRNLFYRLIIWIMHLNFIQVQLFGLLTPCHAIEIS